MVVTFESDGHQYTIDGRPVPSVTQVLSTVGVIEYRGYDHGYGRERGTAVHHATALDDEGDLDEDALDDRVRPYLAAWRAFRAETGFQPSLIEEVMGCALGFCGTPDRIGVWDRHPGEVVLELKTGSTPWWVGLQLAGYEQCYQFASGILDPPCQLVSVTLKEHGGYSILTPDAPRSRSLWRASLAVAQLIYNNEGSYDVYRARYTDARADPRR